MDIYKDNHKLFTNNPLIVADERLSFITDDLSTFDLVTKYDYGAREILTSFLDSDNLDYKLSDIHEAIYMNLLKRLREYTLLYESDAVGENITPSDDYKITRNYGEEEKHFNYGAKSETDAYSQKETTNGYGKREITDTLGRGEQTVTTAPRSTDSQDSRTTFDSTVDYDTTHNVTGTIQTIDSVVDASKVNSREEATHTDTMTEAPYNVTKTQATHSDGVVYEEHTDNVYGYKGNPVKNIETFRKYVSDNTIKKIVADCINTVTYSIYLYTGQM